MLQQKYAVFSAGSERLIERRFEAVRYIQPSPAQAAVPEDYGMSTWMPFRAMFLLRFLEQRALALEVLSAVCIMECQNKFILRQIQKALRVKPVFHGQ